MDNDTQYISLGKAIKYCNYSQEYLSLRARQGKLKAIKIGRNWVTKKEWIKEYLALNGNRVEEVAELLEIQPPDNLPIETPIVKFSVPVIKRKTEPKVRFGFALLLILILLFGGVFLFQRIKSRVSFDEASAILIAMGSKEVQASTINTFKEYAQWLKESFESRAPRFKNIYVVIDNFIEEKITQGYRIVVKVPEPSKKIPEEEVVPQPIKEGMIVIPYPEDEEGVKMKIKESFSDEVRVEPRDETSGIVTPIFKGREGGNPRGWVSRYYGEREAVNSIELGVNTEKPVFFISIFAPSELDLSFSLVMK